MFELNFFVESCRAALADPDPARSIESLVKTVVADPETLRQAFSDAEDVERQGPVTFAYRDAALTVADVTTPPGLISPAHNHKMWAVIGVYEGQEHNRFYRYEDDVLQEKGERLLKEGDVAVLGTEAIHAISNPLDKVSSAIHVYGGDLIEHPQRSMWNPHNQQREDFGMPGMLAYVSEISGK